MAIAFTMVTNGNVPATGVTPGTIFFEENATNDGFQIWQTPASGNPVEHESLSSAEISTLITAALVAYDKPEVVADIAARDALTLTGNQIVYVVDATADATVNSGAATYIWDGAAYQKVSEFESLDVPALDYTAQNW